MIANLHIQNIGIIDDIDISFYNGMNVLTGETGAGKTLIIDSLSIITGGRFSKEMIRKGQDHCLVEVCLYLPENENAMEGNIIVSREIYANGRNLCKINGRMVTVSELKQFMKHIIDIHGQQDNQTILDVSSHIEYLDGFSKEEIQPFQEEYNLLYEEYCDIQVKLKEHYGDDKEKQRKLDLLQYQFTEIEDAHLKMGEEEQLEQMRTKMLHAEKIYEGLQIVDGEIGINAIEAVSQAVRALEKMEQYDVTYGEKLNQLKSIYYDLQELARDVSNWQEDIQFDEQERQKVETRLDLLFSLKRKYGNTIEEMLQYQENIQQEMKQIENEEEYRNFLKQKKEELTKHMMQVGIKMSKIRQKNANILEELMTGELEDLEMKQAKMKIQVCQTETFNRYGLDTVEFFIRTNQGEDFKPLVKIASGGEMSRIMLGIKHVLASIDQVPILIFDEIDTGISGVAANRVAEKMRQIAKHHQILCVTHLASIAAKGEHHYYIAKKVEQDKTKTTIQLLKEEQILCEIARIASGEVNAVTLEHAKQLRKNGEE